MWSLLFRTLLALLPRRFTPRDRAEMLTAHRKRMAVAVRTGRAALVWAGICEVSDLAVAVAHEHLSGSVDALVQDVRLGVRSLRRTPMVTTMAVVSLALGIGATTALFSALDVWLWRPLPVPNHERLVRVSLANRAKGLNGNPLSIRDFEDLRKAARTVDLAVYRRLDASLASGGGARMVPTLRASANILDVLGVQPALGRGFRPEEERAGTPRTVLLTDAYWRSAWNADPGVLGRSVLVDGEACTIIGVLPPRTTLPTMEADIWVPLRLTGNETGGNHSWRALGLTRPGENISAVRQDLETAMAGIVENHPGAIFTDASVESLDEYFHSGSFRQGAYAVGTSVLFVLLIACANIANLLLARGAGRTHEMAVRSALGGGRGRVIRQLLTEDAILAVLGGLAGLAVAYFGIHLLVDVVFPPGEVQGVEYMRLDGRVLTAAAVLTAASVFLFGLVPALRASRVDLRTRLVENGPGTTGGGRGRMGRALMVGEIGMAIALLATTALVIRSLASMHHVDMGFRTDGALSFGILLPETSYPDQGTVRAFHEELTERIRALPGVEEVGSSTTPPIGGFSSASYTAHDPSSGEPRERWAWLRHASPGYLRAMRLHLAAGRWFDGQVDRPGGPLVAVVSRRLAEQEWGSAAAGVGRTVTVFDRAFDVVGVADVGRMLGPQRPSPAAIFLSATQLPSRGMTYVVGVSSNGAGVVAGIRSALRQIDPTLAVGSLSTLREELQATLDPEVVVIEILGTLGALALVLTLVGVYGVVAHSVGSRTPEFGLRAALGADAGSIVRLVLAQSGRLATLGTLIGLVVAVVLGKALSAVLVGVRPFDAVALGATALFTVLAAGAASWAPARRAARVDPARSLQDR